MQDVYQTSTKASILYEKGAGFPWKLASNSSDLSFHYGR